MTRAARFFEGQAAHVAALLLLLVGVRLTAGWPGFLVGEFLGIPTRQWVGWFVVGTVAHQVYVWVMWRWELHYGGVTRTLGSVAFTAYAIGFTILILSRPVLLLAVSYSNRDTLPLAAPLSLGLAVVLLIPAAYTMFSVGRYFGFPRAYGIDHFDAAYRSMPMVEAGMFRFSGNAMYTFGFLGLWAVGLGFRSSAGVALAAFSHLYIWVHYYCTEAPDMRRIYGADSGE